MKQVTITGVDDTTDIEHLKDLQAQYPFVEWGVLFSATKTGTFRYPSLAFIDKLSQTNLNLSAHFCGVFAKNILELNKYNELELLTPAFKRVQLNYSFSYQDTHTVKYKYLKQDLLEYLVQNRRTIILQANKSNEKAVNIFLNTFPASNLNILYDSSGGRGTQIISYPRPLSCYTGYAGGIGPDNVKHVAEILATYNPLPYYIDMESGVRTDNWLDMEKVESVLRQTQSFIL